MISKVICIVYNFGYDLEIEECDTTENQSGTQQIMAEGSTLASLTRICTLCNRAEFRPGQVCLYDIGTETSTVKGCILSFHYNF